MPLRRNAIGPFSRNARVQLKHIRKMKAAVAAICAGNENAQKFMTDVKRNLGRQLELQLRQP